MYQDLYFELLPSIQNVLDSNLSTKEISENCDISQTTVNELRNGKRELVKTSLQNALSLYHFACKNKINIEFTKQREKKKVFPSIPLDLSDGKIMVASEYLDLFAYGILKESYSKDPFPNNNERLKHLDLSKAVFISSNDRIYTCNEFGHSFNCGYEGAGPRNFVNFLKKYSNIEETRLEQIIFNNSVIEYDFRNDIITSYPSLIENRPFSILSLDGKLILLLDKYDNSVLRNTIAKVTLDSAPSNILFLTKILEENYNLSTKIKNIYHIPENSQNSIHSLRYIPKFERPNNRVQIIIEFDDFEIWLPYKIHQTKGDIFKNPEMLSFLDGLGISYNPEKKNFIQTFRNSIENIDKISKLSIHYDENL